MLPANGHTKCFPTRRGLARKGGHQRSTGIVLLVSRSPAKGWSQFRPASDLPLVRLSEWRTRGFDPVGAQRFAIAAKTTDLSGGLTIHACDDADPIGRELSVQVPQFRRASDKSPGLNGAHAIVSGQVTETAAQQRCVECFQAMAMPSRISAVMAP